jgi:hypothetical protein
MKVLLFFLVWCLLLVLCWPVALLALVVLPVLWLLSIPFRVAALVIRAGFALLEAALFLPARLLGWRPRSC